MFALNNKKTICLKEVMKTKTEIWKFFTKRLIEGKKSYTVICNFCQHSFAQNATRMKNHLKLCAKCPATIHNNMSNTKNNVNRSSDNISINENTNSTVSAASMSSGSCSKSSDFLLNFTDRMNYNDQKQAELLLARAIYTSSTPLSIVESDRWKLFFQFLRPSFQLPSRYQISHKLLEEEYIRLHNEVELCIASATNLSIQCDGWSNLRNESILNIIITTPKPVFVKFINTKCNRHTSEYISNLLIETIEQYSPTKFLTVVTDNAANMIKAGNLIVEKFPHITAFGCFAHTLHLLMGDILKIKNIQDLITAGKHIVKSVTGAHLLLAKFTEIKIELKVNVSLSLPVITRWGSHLMFLKNLLNAKTVLENLCVTKDDFLNKKISEVKIKKFIFDETFWDNIQELINLISPICKWITLLESDKPTIHLALKAWRDVRNGLSIQYSYSTLLNKTDRDKIFESLENRDKVLLKPIHFAADIVNPFSGGSHLRGNNDRIDGMKFIRQEMQYMDEEQSNIKKSMGELGSFMTREENYANDFLWETDEETFTPITWWKTFFPGTLLTKVAIRILSMPVTTSATERSFSTQSTIHTSRRNKLTTDRALKLNYIKHNSKLLNTKNDGKLNNGNESNLNEEEESSFSDTYENVSDSENDELMTI